MLAFTCGQGAELEWPTFYSLSYLPSAMNPGHFCLNPFPLSVFLQDLHIP